MSPDMQLSEPPAVHTAMGIRRPQSAVFDAFADPTITTRFWIKDSTGPLKPGATVTWDLNAEGAQADIVVQRFEPGERLVFDWGDDDHKNTVDLKFSPWRDEGCYIEVTETGFGGDADQLAAHAADSTGGFTMALCSLKALLEHDIDLGAVTDRLPDGPGDSSDLRPAVATSTMDMTR